MESLEKLAAGLSLGSFAGIQNHFLKSWHEI